MNLAKVHTLISEEELQKRIKEVAEEINRDYAGKSVHLIGILKGSVFYIVDLAKHLNCTVTMDFMSVSSYANASKSSGVVRLIKDLDAGLIQFPDKAKHDGVVLAIRKRREERDHLKIGQLVLSAH